MVVAEDETATGGLLVVAGTRPTTAAREKPLIHIKKNTYDNVGKMS